MKNSWLSLVKSLAKNDEYCSPGSMLYVRGIPNDKKSDNSSFLYPMSSIIIIAAFNFDVFFLYFKKKILFKTIPSLDIKKELFLSLKLVFKPYSARPILISLIISFIFLSVFICFTISIHFTVLDFLSILRYWITFSSPIPKLVNILLHWISI